jgi:hypothetical protein
MMVEYFQHGISTITDRRCGGGLRMTSIETKGTMDELIGEHRRVTIRQMTAETVMMQRGVHEKVEHS